MAGQRLTAHDTITALTHLGFDPIAPVTLRLWKHRGHLSPGRGYDPAEVAAIYHRRANTQHATHLAA